MPAITIMAEVDGTIAVTTVQVDELDWASIDAARVARADSLPRQILEVTICANRGAFRQIFPELVEERTSWWKLWWK